VFALDDINFVFYGATGVETGERLLIQLVDERGGGSGGCVRALVIIGICSLVNLMVLGPREWLVAWKMY
jgi:hypothetical protein